jgi:hypothetical protein
VPKRYVTHKLPALYDHQYEPLHFYNAPKHASNAATALFITAYSMVHRIGFKAMRGLKKTVNIT